MLKRVIVGDGEVRLCATCMNARGMNDDDVLEGARRSGMDEFGEAPLAADRVLAASAIREIYLDHNASTPSATRVAAGKRDITEGAFGNPSQSG